MTENTSDDSHIASRADLTGSSHLDNESERQAADLRHGIVIVSNDASRTGAPLTALNIAREFVARGIPVVTILLLAGDLEPEFARAGRCQYHSSLRRCRIRGDPYGLALRTAGGTEQNGPDRSGKGRARWWLS
jgi:hypothetical protein